MTGSPVCAVKLAPFMHYNRKKRLLPEEYIHGIEKGDKLILSKAITLIESTLPEDNQLAELVMERIMYRTGNSIRIGITGVPGVGKSAFINSFGTYITSLGKKLAVLAIDPTSRRSKGSILGDKTRMEDLSIEPSAFIRPTPTGSSLGGVASKTRETMLLCEAAGYDVIFVETVGVGQSETTVHDMVDFFLLLMLAGAGDELQGMKKGIVEMADSIIITKSDGDNIKKAEIARREYEKAMHLFPPGKTGWYPKVLTCSAIKNEGIREVWNLILENYTILKGNGIFYEKRQQQYVAWMHRIIQQNLESGFYNNPAMRRMIKIQENLVANEKIAANRAAGALLKHYNEIHKNQPE
jgi:LAO/AO transport system kinase